MAPFGLASIPLSQVQLQQLGSRNTKSGFTRNNILMLLLGVGILTLFASETLQPFLPQWCYRENSLIWIKGWYSTKSPTDILLSILCSIIVIVHILCDFLSSFKLTSIYHRLEFVFWEQHVMFLWRWSDIWEGISGWGRKKGRWKVRNSTQINRIHISPKFTNWTRLKFKINNSKSELFSYSQDPFTCIRANQKLTFSSTQHAQLHPKRSGLIF